MALSKEQFVELRRQGLSVQQIVDFEAGNTPRVRQESAGNQFEQEKPETLGGKTLGFIQKGTDLLFGGGKLAEGLGKSLAAPSVQKNLTEAEQNLSDIELQLVKRINEKKKLGEDTSRLEKARLMLREDAGIARDAQEDFTNSLPTNKEVIGSSLRLGTSALLPTVAGKVNALTGAGVAVGVGSGVARGALSGAITGTIGGTAYGIGSGFEANKDAKGIALSGLGGGVAGAAGGTIAGGIGGGFVGRSNYNKAQQGILDAVTPNVKDLTPTQYKKLLAEGRINPKTATQPAQYVLSDDETATILKFKDVVTKDPVKTTTNIYEKISSLDDDVGSFLARKNSIFNKGELRNQLIATLDDYTDITADPTALQKAKEKLVNTFVDNIETNNMTSLWKARKVFDRKIESAFSGSPSLQKSVKIAFRNSVQDFISSKTDDVTYKAYMSDMKNLFRLADLTKITASKERGQSAINLWIKNNPKIAALLGITIAGVASTIGIRSVSGDRSD